MGARFKNSRDRTQRAASHARAFADEWDAIMGVESSRSELRQEKGTGWWVIYASLTPEAQERANRNTLSLELGELAYQLRAALDGLMWDAVTHIQSSEPPTGAANGLQFPTLNGKDRDFKKCGLHKFPFPQKLVDWLESIQPDAADKPAGDPDMGLKVTLEDIHNLARFDRHRRLRVIAASPQKLAVAPVTLPPGGKIVAMEWLPNDLFGGEQKLARLKIVCPGGLAAYQVHIKAQATFDISVEDVEMCGGENVGAQLARFIQAVDHVIDRFDAEFP